MCSSDLRELISILGLFCSDKYGILVWGSCRQGIFLELESIHLRAAKLTFNLDWCMPSRSGSRHSKMETLESTYEKRLLIVVHQAYYHLLPCPMSCLMSIRQV